MGPANVAKRGPRDITAGACPDMPIRTHVEHRERSLHAQEVHHKCSSDAASSKHTLPSGTAFPLSQEPRHLHLRAGHSLTPQWGLLL